MITLKFKRKTAYGEYIYFCPFCDDKSGHLYINPKLNVYHCFRCNTSGRLTDLILKYHLGSEIISLLMTTESSSRHDVTKEHCVKPTKLNKYLHDVSDYLHKRLGHIINLDKISLCDIKVALNGNRIDPRYIWFETTKGYIGRSMSDNSGRGIKRYKTFTTTKKNTKFRRHVYYLGDLDYTENKQLVITEGIFDTIVAKYMPEINLKLIYKNPEDILYIAALSHNFVNAIKTLYPDKRRQYFKRIILIIDNEDFDDYLEHQINELARLTDLLLIAYNKVSKDLSDRQVSIRWRIL